MAHPRVHTTASCAAFAVEPVGVPGLALGEGAPESTGGAALSGGIRMPLFRRHRHARDDLDTA